MTRHPAYSRAAGGFTLVEVIVVTFIVLIVGAGLLTTFLTGQTSYVSADAYVLVQQEARRALDSMVRELREAGWGTPSPPYKAPGVIVATASQLDFQLALGYNLTTVPGCPADAVCWGASDQSGVSQHNWSIRYREAAGPNGTTQLVREILNTANVVQPGTRVLANYVNPATTSFAWDNVNRTATITFESRYQHPAIPNGGQTTGMLTSRVRVRNS